MIGLRRNIDSLQGSNTRKIRRHQVLLGVCHVSVPDLLQAQDGDYSRTSNISDDDDDSLQSLDFETGNASEDLRIQDENLGKLLHHIKQSAFQVLRDCKSSDPSMKLNEYYQKEGVPQISKNFAFKEWCGQGQSQKFYSASFTCPLSGTKASSCLPLNLWIENNEEDQELRKVTTEFFSEYSLLSNDGMVYFKGKKAAKRSTCLNMYLQLTTKNRTFFESKDQAQEFLVKQQATGRYVPPLPQRRVPPQEATAPRKPRESFGKFQTTSQNSKDWAARLNALGVKAHSITISYCEVRRAKPYDADWDPCSGPTYVVCELSVSHPVKTVTVLGTAQPTKRQTRDCAVTQLSQYMRNEEDWTPEDDYWCSSGTADDDDDYQNVKLIRARDKSVTNYENPLPGWAAKPVEILLDTANNTQTRPLYFYELALLEEVSGQNLFASRMNYDPLAMTSMGIVFPEDPLLEACGHQMQSKQEIKTKVQLGQELIAVVLRRRVEIHLTEKEAKAKLDWMKHFNAILHSWKEYGVVKKAGMRKTHFGVAEDANFSRSYLLVPLCAPQLYHEDASNDTIDWKLLEQIAQYKTTPFLTYPHRIWERHFSFGFGGGCPLDMDFVLGTQFLVGLLMIAPVLENKRQHLESWQLLVYLLHMSSAADILFLYSQFPLQQQMDMESLKNRFLVQDPKRNRLYVASTTTVTEARQDDQQVNTLTGASPLLFTEQARQELTDGKIQYNRDKFGLDLPTATFADYYLKKYRQAIRYPQQPLIEAVPVMKQKDLSPFHQALTTSNLEMGPVHLMPELIQCLAMPRNILYLGGILSDIMPALEREISLMKAQEALSRIESPLLTSVDPSKKTAFRHRMNLHCTSETALLAEATTLQPVTYQRLEFLGDAVLGFCLAVEIMSRNSGLYWDSEDFKAKISHAARNAVLVDAALRICLNRVLSHNAHWQSAYHIAGKVKKQRASTVEIADKTLSDAVESLLAVCYFHSKSSASGTPCRLFGLFQLLQLPLPPRPESEDSSELCARGLCLQNGYPWELDTSWKDTILSLEQSIAKSPVLQTRLMSCLQQCLDILEASFGLSAEKRTEITEGRNQVLLMAALFDDSLDGGREDHELIPLAMFRDNLFYVGAHGLQLMVSEQVYSRYSEATPGDLHLLRSCASNDDVMVYVMIKLGLHSCLYDTNDGSASIVQAYMNTADEKGLTLWDQLGGWVAQGRDEYHRRCRERHANNSFLDSGPRYPGLAGGRFFGWRKKVSDDIKGDLVFSFKALLGAIVLAVGLEGMWELFGTALEELLILSPDELRAVFQDTSSICQNYASGRSVKKPIV